MLLERHSAGVPIIKEGDPSNGKVYIVLSGELFVVINEPDIFVHENVESLNFGDIAQKINEGNAQLEQTSSGKPFLLSKRMLLKGDNSLVATPKSSANDDSYGTPRNRLEQVT